MLLPAIDGTSGALRAVKSPEPPPAEKPRSRDPECCDSSVCSRGDDDIAPESSMPGAVPASSPGVDAGVGPTGV